MSVINSIISNLYSIQENIDVIIHDTLQETQEYLTDDIRSQLIKGVDATGHKFSPKYKNAKYAEKKFAMNPEPGLFNPDLKLSGNLHAGLFELLYEENILISSHVDYAGILEEKYGIEIFEPTKQNLNDYINQHFKPVFLEKIRRLL